MNRASLFLAAVILAAVAACAGAAELLEEGKTWSDKAEFSFVDTGGNTDTTSLAGKNRLAYRITPKTTGSWRIGALYSRDRGETTAESYETELRFDRMFTERIFAYILGGWSTDRFAGIDRRNYGGAGAGHRILMGPAHFLAAEAGLNHTREYYIDGTDHDFITGRGFAKYEYAIGEKNRLSQSLEFLYDFSDSRNFKVISETAAVMILTDIFSLKAGYVLRYDNTPFSGEIEKADTRMSVALVVDF